MFANRINYQSSHETSININKHQSSSLIIRFTINLHTNSSLTNYLTINPHTYSSLIILFTIKPHTYSSLMFLFTINPHTNSSLIIRFTVNPRTDSSLIIRFTINPHTDSSLMFRFTINPHTDSSLIIRFTVNPHTDSSLILRFVCWQNEGHTVVYTNEDRTEEVTAYYCNYHRTIGYIVYKMLALFLVPALIMTGCYTAVIRELWKSTKNISSLTNTGKRWAKDSAFLYCQVTFAWFAAKYSLPPKVADLVKIIY